ncbi:MAG TPA: hypothetical protein VHU23_08945 [Rhizomicrobium sp.]|jgi:hypothetical protein|nr:hypothetical protein [Rhizomicrobium sp.]
MLLKSTPLSNISTASLLGTGLSVLLCLSLSGAAEAASISKTAATRLHKSWRTTITTTALPGQGCFTADYPSLVWKQVACTNAPGHPFAPAHRAPAGFGDDYSAQVTSPITMAVGSFPAITGLASEKSAGVSDQYSLQLNTPYFSSPACQSSPDPQDCEVWQQFVFAQSGGKKGVSSGFMEYWLINYGPYCPSGWNQAALNCWIDSAAVSVPHQKLSALGGLQLSGAAAKSGNDSVTVTTSKKAYAISAADSFLDLAGSWRGAEFNVLGETAGSQANFNKGTNITVNISLTDGSTTAPSCGTNDIFTYETNNLGLGSCKGASGNNPSITFSESD